MANQKKLQKAAIKFCKENPIPHYMCSALLSRMANFITESGAAEVTVGLKDGEYYEYANN
jgi:hypothetical protein